MSTTSDSDRLLAWYASRRRDLPWRSNRDPYRIWISEIMLQQTRVGTVIPYFEAFLERFPTLAALAAAPLDEVLAAWSGLGYYRRARQLYRTAQVVAAAGGGFPASSRELQELPGIGPYTAAAIASIAFGEAVPVLDGNVERLLCRRLGKRQDPKRAATRRELLVAAAALLDKSCPGDSNQALMELGATVCRPQQPVCERCPLAPGCVARMRGDPQSYPAPKPRRKVEHRPMVVAVVRRRGRVLLFRRPEDSELMPGLWELPNVPGGDPAGAEAALGRRYGGRWHLGEARGEVRHAVTYRALRLSVFAARWTSRGEIGEGPEAAWVGEVERPSFPVSSMVDKVLARS